MSRRNRHSPSICLLVALTLTAGCSSARQPSATNPVSPSVAASMAGTHPTKTPSATRLSLPAPSPTVFEPVALWSADSLYGTAWLPDSSGIAQSLLRTGVPGLLLYDAQQFREAWLIPHGLSMALAAAPGSDLLALPDPTESFVDLVHSGDGSTARPTLESTSCWGAHIGLFEPRGTMLLTGHFPVEPFPRSSIYAWDLDSNSCQPVLLDHEGVLQSLRLSNDGSVLATGLSELFSREAAGEPTSQVILWDFPSMQLRCWVPGQWARFDTSEDLIVVSGDSAGGVAFYQIEDCRPWREITGASWPFAIAPNTSVLASASSNYIKFIDAKTGATLQVLPWRYKGVPTVIEFSPNGQLLLVASAGNGTPSSATITLWRVPDFSA